MWSAHTHKNTQRRAPACTPVDNCSFKKTYMHAHKGTQAYVCVLCCALSTDGASVKDTNESNETEGKTAPEIYTTVKHLRETVREQRELV